MKKLLLIILATMGLQCFGQPQKDYDLLRADTFLITADGDTVNITNTGVGASILSGCINKVYTDRIWSQYICFDTIINGDTVRLIKRKQYEPTLRELVEEYLQWCEDNGIKPSLEAFDQWMEKR